MNVGYLALFSPPACSACVRGPGYKVKLLFLLFSIIGEQTCGMAAYFHFDTIDKIKSMYYLSSIVVAKC